MRGGVARRLSRCVAPGQNRVHGVVSGAPDFFKRAFGDTSEDFEQILLLPHDFTFNRDWYERFDTKQELQHYHEVANTLDANDRAELLTLLSSVEPKDIVSLPKTTANRRLKDILPFYVPKPKNELFEIWRKQRERLNAEKAGLNTLAEDERVEDAGLEADDTAPTPIPLVATTQKSQRAM